VQRHVLAVDPHMGEVVVVAQVREGVRLDRGDFRPVQLAIAVSVLLLDHVGAEHLIELPVVPHAHQHAVLEQERGHGVDPDVGMGSRWTGAKHQGAAGNNRTNHSTPWAGHHRGNSTWLSRVHSVSRDSLTRRCMATRAA
jgi:hypothetical protein